MKHPSFSARGAYLAIGIFLLESFLHAQGFAQDANPAPNMVAKEGTTILDCYGYRGSWDIDFNILGKTNGADIFWACTRPVSGAPDGEDFSLSVVATDSKINRPEARIVRIEDRSYEDADYGYLRNLDIYRKIIPRRVLAPGTALAVKTSEGLCAKLRVVRFYARGEYIPKGNQCFQLPPDDIAQALAPFYYIELQWTLYQEAGKEKILSLEGARDRLSQAFWEWDVQTVKELLTTYPDLLTMNTTPWPLHQAASTSNPEVLGVLLEKGVDVNANQIDPSSEKSGEAERQKKPSAKPQAGNYALWHAVSSRRPENVKVLCEHGANVNAIVPAWKDEPLLNTAVFDGDPRIVALLLDHGAQLPKTDRERVRLRKSLRDGARYAKEREGWGNHVKSPGVIEDYEATGRVLEAHGFK